MRNTSIIHNHKALKWGLNIQEAYLFSWLYELPSWANRSIIGNDIYYFASKGKIIEELPMLTDKPDTVYRHLKSLKDKGIIDLKKVDGRDYVAITVEGSTWNKYDGKSEDSEINPTLFGKKSELNSEKNPTYNIYSLLQIDNITKDNSQIFFKNSEKAINSHVRSVFEAKYFQEHKTDFIFSAKEAGQIKYLVQSLIVKMKEKSGQEFFTKEEIQQAINFFIASSWEVLDDWQKSNFSLSLLRSNFNSIFTKIKNGKGPTTKQPGQRAGVSDFKFPVPTP